MAFVEITDVCLTPCDETGLAGFFLDAPLVGYRSDSPILEVIGWCVGKREVPTAIQIAPAEHGDFHLDAGICAGLAGHEKLHSIYDLHDSTKILAPINCRRPDVAAEYPDRAGSERSGFEASIGLVGLPPQFEIVLKAVYPDGSKSSVAVVRGTRRCLQSSFVPTIHPLILTMLGRTGSSWFMRLMSEHPAIYVNPSQHYETRVASHWLHMLKLLAEPRTHFHVVDNAAITSWLSGSHLEEIAAFCQKSIDLTYQQFIARAGRQAIAYFAEKYHPDHIPRLARELDPQAREIFLVRDPRDMLCSILAINAKRGHADFLRGLVDSDREYVDVLRSETLRVLAAWHSRADGSILVRYEDLILQPSATLRRAFDYLSLDATALTIERIIQRASVDTPEMEFHRTSSSVFDSIGRWRRDLPAGLQAACLEEFVEVLNAFGYDGGSTRCLDRCRAE